MKKITLSLLAGLGFITLGFSQANITLLAPPFNGSTPFRAPGGTASQTGMSACYLVLPSELTNLTVGTLSSFGFSLTNGTGSIPVTGTFTLYLQNTPDLTYNKGLAWSGITSGMTTAYVGNMTIPATTNTAVITMPVSFPYGGNGLYVAFNWESTGPFSAASATYAANGSLTTGNGGGATTETLTLPTPTTLFMSTFRPCFIFTGANTATNEVSVIGVEAAGKVPALFGFNQTPVAYIKNGSSVTKNNIVVSLNVGAPNAFANTQTITSLASGAVGTVTFAAFPTPSTGLTNMSVSVAPDQVLANNQVVWTQSVTCFEGGYNPPLPATSFSMGGYGFGNGSGIISFYYAPVNGGSLTAVRCMVPSLTQNVGKKICAVLLDASANIVALGSNTVTIGAANFNTFVGLNFAAPQDLVPATDYYIGVCMLAPTPASGTYPIGYMPSTIPLSHYYASPEAGGSINPVTGLFYLAFEASFIFPSTVIMASSGAPVICQGESVQLTAAGATSYTWSGNTGSGTVHIGSVIVTPTINIVYNVSGTGGAGCKTNQVNISQSVAICAGVYMNQSELSGIKLFPNPAVNGKSEITGLSGMNTITIFNLLGQIVSTQQTEKETVSIDLSNEPNGAYLVKIFDANKDTRIVKIVNQN